LSAGISARYCLLLHFAIKEYYSQMPRQKNPTKSFKKTIWSHYKKHRRSFPWREEITPYRVVVSEIMLQQTQAPRVVAKFESFIKKFPDFPTLARAPLAEVLTEWQGLGYNRRALYLKQLAKAVINTKTSEKTGAEKYAAGLPQTKAELVNLPGIGPNTAGSILAFAFNIAEPFIETNIRSVFIHFFFAKKQNVHDKNILKLVEQTIDHKNPREWFFALMDYGVMLKQAAKTARTDDPSRKSKHYVRQSPFKGSNRELRAALVRTILEKSPKKSGVKIEQIITAHLAENNRHRTRENILKNLAALEREGFIVINKKGNVIIPS